MSGDPGVGQPVRLSVLMACHNRAELTGRCLRSLDTACGEAGIRGDAAVFLVDDASSDATAEVARSAWPGVRVIEGDGDLHWSGGMALAERVALGERPDATHLLWLNDDVDLDPTSLGDILQTASRDPQAIVVAALRGDGGEVSYSGIRLTDRRHPLRFELVEPAAGPVAVDTLNGNLVLVPVGVATRLGGIDSTFRHAFADFDYGVRAAEARIDVILAPGTHGTCRRDGRDERPNLAGRARDLVAPTGGALPDVIRYLRRHGSPAAVLYALVPLLRFAAGEFSRIPFVGRLVPGRALPSRRR